MAKIAIDCDGVLANFNYAFGLEAKRIFLDKVNLKHESTEWNDLFGLTRDEQHIVWERIIERQNWWLGVDAFSDNIVALQLFLYQHKKNDIWIVTSRTPTEGLTVAEQTNIWLSACGVSGLGNYLGVITVDHWYQKRRVYENVGIEYSVDDKRETVEDCDRLKEHKAFLLERSHNAGAEVKRRVPSLREFFAAIALDLQSRQA